jgi:DNA-binding beta-propeller fold protein YncE
MRVRAGWLVGVALLGLAACGRQPKEPPFTGEPFLLVWAGDDDRRHSDFLAVVDAAWDSDTYGKVLATVPVKSRGNEPQGLNAEPRQDQRVFATGALTNRTFVFDAADPKAIRLVHVDEPQAGRELWAPRTPVTLPNGRVAVTAPDRARYRGMAVEVLATPGGLVELDAAGQFVREVPAIGPATRGLIVAPYGAAAWRDILVTTNRGHGFAATTRGSVMPGISVQVWRAPDLELRQTVVLDAGPRGEENLGPHTVRFAPRTGVAFVNTHEGGALYASDSTDQEHPAFRLVFDFGPGALCGGAAVTPDGRFYVTALTGRNRLAAMDVQDPWHPKLASAIRFDRDPGDETRTRAGGPGGVAMSADGTRVAVSDYTIDVPGQRLDGDRRVHLVRLDPGTGRLRFDTAFRDEVSGEVGLDFGRSTWPHGETGPARPHGLLFVAAAPPAKKK